MNILSKPVKNLTKGRGNYRPEAIVIHIAEGSNMSGTYSWFNNPNSKASSHYGVRKNGEVWQFVSDRDTAWHAGGVAEPNWRVMKPNVNPNLYTIGIEHEGFTGETFTTAMYNSTASLIALLNKRWGIPIDRDHIIGHYQINSRSRSRCPGSGVDLNKLISLAKEIVKKPEMEKEIQRLTAENVKLKSDLATSNSSLANTQKQLGQWKAAAEDLERGLKSTQAKLAIAEGEIASLKQAIKSGQTKALVEQIELLKKQNSDLNLQLARTQDQLALVRDELNKLKTNQPNNISVIDSIVNFINGILGRK